VYLFIVNKCFNEFGRDFIGENTGENNYKGNQNLRGIEKLIWEKVNR